MFGNYQTRKKHICSMVYLFAVCFIGFIFDLRNPGVVQGYTTNSTFGSGVLLSTAVYVATNASTSLSNQTTASPLLTTQVSTHLTTNKTLTTSSIKNQTTISSNSSTKVSSTLNKTSYFSNSSSYTSPRSSSYSLSNSSLNHSSYSSSYSSSANIKTNFPNTTMKVTSSITSIKTSIISTLKATTTPSSILKTTNALLPTTIKPSTSPTNIISTTPSYDVRIRQKMAESSQNATNIIDVFNDIENNFNISLDVNAKVDGNNNNTNSYTQNIGEGITNLTNTLMTRNFSKEDWIRLTNASLNLDSKFENNMTDLKMAMNNMILTTSSKILEIQPVDEPFGLNNTFADIAGLKTNPENLNGFQLETQYGNLIVPSDMKESESSVFFKMICYKDEPLKLAKTNEYQSSSVFVSLVDDKNKPIANEDPDKTYQVVLKPKNNQIQSWQNLTEKPKGIFVFKVVLKENTLSLVELSPTEIVVWGKMNEAPTRYNYHFYYSAVNTNSETLIKDSNLKVKKYDKFLRIVIQSSRPNNTFFFRVDSKGGQVLKKRSIPVESKMRTFTTKPFVRKGNINNKNEPFNIQDTSIDVNHNVILKTNLFGTFTSVISYVTPQALNFDEIFVDFNKKVLNNPYVLIVLLVIILFYSILAVWVRRLDQKDLISWSYMPLSDNNQSDPYQYLIRVQTGIRSSRVMSATPYFILKGVKGETAIRVLCDGARKNLGSGTVSAYLLQTAKYLGPLLTLKIWHNNEGSTPRWFLSKIVIKDVAKDTWYSFPCHEWLAFDKGNGTIIHQLESHSNESDNFFTTIKNRIHVGFFDDHLYISVIKRPQSSNFTRLQRLSSLTAVLYLSLITSAMYYNPDEKVPSRALKLGPFIMTSKEIAVGIISSAIMVIPTAIIIGLFKWRRMKGEESENFENSSTFIERLKRFRLPWWSIYPAYFLVFLSIGASAYFTFIYSIVWGKQLALQWLLSVIVNVTGSVLFVQPFKIIILAMLTSCILQSPQQDYIDSKKYFTEETPPQGEVKICPPPKLSNKKWKNKKRIMELNNKMFKIFQSFSFKFFYIVICLIFILNEKTNTKFHQNNAIKRQLQIENLKKNDGTDAMWQWITKYAVPVIFPHKHYDGKVLTINSQRFLADQVNLRLGAVRFRQIRTEKGWSWSNTTKDKTILSAFDYTTDSNSEEEFEQIGVLENYENGGYIMDINDRYRKAQRILEMLRSANWLDVHTRCLFIIVNTYNANSGLYMQTIVKIEKPFLGNLIATIKVTSFKLYPFVDLWDYIMLLVLLIFVCVAIASIVSQVVCVVKTKTLFSYTFLLATLNTISTIMVITGYTLRIKQLLTFRDELYTNPQKYISGAALIFEENIYKFGLGIYIFMTTLSLCQPLNINYHFFLMKASIFISIPYLYSFVILLSVMVSSFSFLTYLLFYLYMYPFRTLSSTYMTLFRIFLLISKYKQTFNKNNLTVHFIFIIYTFSTAIVLMNICIGILNESFAFIKTMQRKIGCDYMFDWELNEHFWDQLMSLFQSKQKIKKESIVVKKDDDCSNELDTLSNIDKILDNIIFHQEKENNLTQLKCLILCFMVNQSKSVPLNSGQQEIESREALPTTNVLKVKKEKNDNHIWTYWYYSDNFINPLLKISFFCESEDPGEIVCCDVQHEKDILTKTQNELISYTSLAPTIGIFSNLLQEAKKNKFEIVYFCVEPLHPYDCCQLIQSFDGMTWLESALPQMTHSGVEKHILEDTIEVEELPTYLTLVKRYRREYLCWDDGNPEKISLLEPSLSLRLSARDAAKNKCCSAILKMNLESGCFHPVFRIILNIEVEEPISFWFQNSTKNETQSLRLYSKTGPQNWIEENQLLQEKAEFLSKPQANQETSYMLRQSQIKWAWRNEIKSLKDPMNEELFLKISQKVGNKWKKLGVNLGVSQKMISRIQKNTSDLCPEIACYKLLTQWHQFSNLTANKVQFLTTALLATEEDLSQIMGNNIELYENEFAKVIEESTKVKLFDQISRSEKIVSSWKEIGKHLGLTKTEIEKIEKCEILTEREKCYNALMSWKNFNQETLKQQLAEMGFSFLAGKVSSYEKQ